jgi:hypothetical protein
VLAFVAPTVSRANIAVALLLFLIIHRHRVAIAPSLAVELPSRRPSPSSCHRRPSSSVPIEFPRKYISYIISKSSHVSTLVTSSHSYVGVTYKKSQNGHKNTISSKSHHNIALFPLNNTRQQIKSWSPLTSHNDKKWTTNSPP